MKLLQLLDNCISTGVRFEADTKRMVHHLAIRRNTGRIVRKSNFDDYLLWCLRRLLAASCEKQHTYQYYDDVFHNRVMSPNDLSSATRPTGRHDCNSDAMAGFAAAHG